MLVAVWFVAYFVPTIVAAARQKKTLGSILVINFLLGWTVIGWIWAFVLALRGEPQPQIVYVPTHEPETAQRYFPSAPAKRFVMHCDSCRHEWVSETRSTTCAACLSTYVKPI
jgi:hypothetical protein